MSHSRFVAVDESTGEADPTPWTRPALNGLWYSGGLAVYLFLGEVRGVDAATEADPARWTPLAVNGLWYAGG